MAIAEVSQHNPPRVSAYAVKCWQAQPWLQLQHAQLLSEQWAGLALDTECHKCPVTSPVTTLTAGQRGTAQED